MRLDLKAPSSDGDGLTGKVINLLTNDANRFDMAVLFFMEMIRAPIEGLIVIFILYSYIGSAALIGVAFLLCFIPLQG